MYTIAVIFWQRHIIASDRVAGPIESSGVRQSSSQFPWCPQQHIQGRFRKYFQDIFKPLLAEVGRNSWHRLSMKSDKILFSAHSTFILRTEFIILDTKRTRSIQFVIQPCSSLQVLHHFSSEGLVEVCPFTLPGRQPRHPPALVHLYKSEISAAKFNSMQQMSRMECFYRWEKLL